MMNRIKGIIFISLVFGLILGFLVLFFWLGYNYFAGEIPLNEDVLFGKEAIPIHISRIWDCLFPLFFALLFFPIFYRKDREIDGFDFLYEDLGKVWNGNFVTGIILGIIIVLINIIASKIINIIELSNIFFPLFWAITMSVTGTLIVFAIKKPTPGLGKGLYLGTSVYLCACAGLIYGLLTGVLSILLVMGAYLVYFILNKLNSL